MDATAVIVAAVGAVSSVAAAVYTARTTTGAGERASIRQVEAGAYERARESYEGALARMQAEIDRQARQMNTLQRQVARLLKQVRDAGLVPVTSSEEDDSP